MITLGLYRISGATGYPAGYQLSGTYPESGWPYPTLFRINADKNRVKIGRQIAEIRSFFGGHQTVFSQTELDIGLPAVFDN
jgi:hypothetical protein